MRFDWRHRYKDKTIKLSWKQIYHQRSSGISNVTDRDELVTSSPSLPLGSAELFRKPHSSSTAAAAAWSEGKGHHRFEFLITTKIAEQIALALALPQQFPASGQGSGARKQNERERVCIRIQLALFDDTRPPSTVVCRRISKSFNQRAVVVVVSGIDAKKTSLAGLWSCEKIP